MKYKINAGVNILEKSPSIRREWIEMLIVNANGAIAKSPSIRREWIEITKLLRGCH